MSESHQPAFSIRVSWRQSDTPETDETHCGTEYESTEPLLAWKARNTLDAVTRAINEQQSFRFQNKRGEEVIINGRYIVDAKCVQDGVIWTEKKT